MGRAKRRIGQAVCGAMSQENHGGLSFGGEFLELESPAGAGGFEPKDIGDFH